MKAAQSNLARERSAALLGGRSQVWGGGLRSDVASRYLGYAHRLKCGAEARKWSDSRPSRHSFPLIIARHPRNGSYPSVFRSTRPLFQPAVDCVGSLREVQNGTRIRQAPRTTGIIPSSSPSMSLNTCRFWIRGQPGSQKNSTSDRGRNWKRARTQAGSSFFAGLRWCEERGEGIRNALNQRKYSRSDERIVTVLKRVFCCLLSCKPKSQKSKSSPALSR